MPARTQYWHGVTTSLNARLRNGLTLQAGTSAGRGVQDTCALVKALPETLVVLGINQQQDYCHVTEPFATLFRGLAAYTVPKIDVLISANIRSVPNANIGMGSNSATNGASRNANYNVPNTVVAQSLGRLPNGGLANGTTTVNLLIPGELCGPRVTQVDMRFAKVLKFGATRADVGVDLYNLFQYQQSGRVHRNLRLCDERRDVHAPQRHRAATTCPRQREVQLLRGGGWSGRAQRLDAPSGSAT